MINLVLTAYLDFTPLHIPSVYKSIEVIEETNAYRVKHEMALNEECGEYYTCVYIFDTDEEFAPMIPFLKYVYQTDKLEITQPNWTTTTV